MQSLRLGTMIKRRPGVAVVAYACLLAQVATFAHRVLVQHVTCAEHGESVHVAAPGRGGDLAAIINPVRVLSSSASVPLRASGVPAVVADDHDHCSVLLSRALSGQSHPQQGVAPAAAGLGFNNPCPRLRGTDLDTYLLAPKTSPPARA